MIGKASSTVRLPDGELVPALGQGTWLMGAPEARREETAALRGGVELGLTLIDTAEIYGDGQAETLVGEALGGDRDGLFLVSKVAPENAGLGRIALACEASLGRLNTDRIDLYLLHWRGPRPLSELVEGMEALKAAGRIRHWGVSNFDVADMDELIAAGGQGCAANQVLYNLRFRGPEFDLLPWMAERSMPLMAYSPVEKGRLLDAGALMEVAARRGASPAQVALAWSMRDGRTMAIPKAGRLDHVQDNRGALDVRLSAEDLAELDAAFAPPVHKIPLRLL